MIAFTSAIIGAIVGAILSAMYFLHERTKQKNALLSLLFKELSSYSEPKEKHDQAYFQQQSRSQLIWNILTCGILDIKKSNDKELIDCLYELVGWIENFNYYNDYSNQCLLNGIKERESFFNRGREQLYSKMYEYREEVLTLLQDKYNITILPK